MLSYNTTIVLAGTGLLGLASGMIGSFAVLRRRALLGDALAHAALPGICLAFLITGTRSFPLLLCGALVTAVIGMSLVAFISRNTRTKSDAAIGIVLSVFFGAGVVLLKVIQNSTTGGGKAGLSSFIFGKTASMIAGDVWAIGALVLAVLAVTVLLYKEFKLVSFDAEFAAVQGWPAGFLDYLQLALLAITIVVGLPAVGVVLMAALLILPGAAARFWTERLGVLLVLAGIFGLVAGATGTLVSSMTHTVELPAGPTIVLVGTAIFTASMAFAPGRGVLAQFLRRRSMSKKNQRQHVLRAAYEVLEQGLPERRPFALEEIVARRGWSRADARRALASAESAGLVVGAPREHHWQLTERGFHQAADVTRRHRLWELYLIECADLAADHVDRDADLVEHVMPPELVGELERQLARAGRLPARGEVPSSPHHIPEASRD